jgi:hypothetical protein
MSLTAVIASTLRATYTKTSDIAGGVQQIDETLSASFDNGVGANQANVLFADTRTLGASATEDLDLTGSLSDVFGASLVNARIKGIRISAAPGNTNNVVVGAAGSNPWATLLNATGTLTLPPGAVITAWVPTAAGWAVTAATGDLLKFANSAGGTGVTYTIEVIGGAS